ncbi:MAG: sugar ABC transporter permease [Lachnospiraceae bacterium]|nr:sugar ABC transporter permease [Lachnospiraceae bacterium]
MSNKRKFRIGPYLFILPAFLVSFTFIIIPLIISLTYSFTDYNLISKNFIGLGNYKKLFTDIAFKRALVNTLKYTFFVVGINAILGLVVATFLNEKWLRGSKIFRTIIYTPYTVSIVAASMIWLYLYDPNGLLNVIMSALGLKQQLWLDNPNMAMGCLIVVAIWQGMGYCMVMYLAGYQSIPSYLYEAARIDGASKIQMFFKISIPMLAPTTYLTLIMTIMSSFQVFGQVYNMTGGGPAYRTTTLVHQIYMQAFVGWKMGYASTISVVLLVISMTITLLLFRYGNRDGGAEVDQ